MNAECVRAERPSLPLHEPVPGLNATAGYAAVEWWAARRAVAQCMVEARDGSGGWCWRRRCGCTICTAGGSGLAACEGSERLWVSHVSAAGLCLAKLPTQRTQKQPGSKQREAQLPDHFHNCGAWSRVAAQSQPYRPVAPSQPRPPSGCHPRSLTSAFAVMVDGLHRRRRSVSHCRPPI